MYEEHNSLDEMTKSQHVALVQGVLDHDEEAIAVFRLCILRLLITIANERLRSSSYSAYTSAEMADITFAYIIYGIRPTGGIKPANDLESPLYRWLLSPDSPLHKYIANIAYKFMGDLPRDWVPEHKKLRHFHKQKRARSYKKKRLYTGQNDNTNDHSHTDRSQLQDCRSPVEESVMTSHLAEGWIRQLTDQEQAIIRRISLTSDDVSQKEVAKSLGISDATMSRRMKALRANLDSYLDGE